MAVYTARICFEVAYHADPDEMVTHARVRRLADEMLLVLRRSTRIKVIEIAPNDIEHIREEQE